MNFTINQITNIRRIKRIRKKQLYPFLKRDQQEKVSKIKNVHFLSSINRQCRASEKVHVL